MTPASAVTPAPDLFAVFTVDPGLNSWAILERWSPDRNQICRLFHPDRPWEDRPAEIDPRLWGRICQVLPGNLVGRAVLRLERIEELITDRSYHYTLSFFVPHGAAQNWWEQIGIYHYAATGNSPASLLSWVWS
jgi:hypothetical protein